MLKLYIFQRGKLSMKLYVSFCMIFKIKCQTGYCYTKIGGYKNENTIVESKMI